ncbi:sensor histidine kinase [Streptosporangium sp. NPDC000396]|uniref:sensor histidine kinase n=1 Tax=Streptosporangium sp. NPDC000396 TaxID=3366185 RepID=UPI003675498B
MRRDDALGAVVCFLVGLALLAAGAYLPRATPAYLLVGPLLVSCLAVAVRRSSPMACLWLGVVAAVADCFAGPSMATILIFTDNLYSAVRYGPAVAGRWLLGITSVLAVVGGVGAAFVFDDLSLLALVAVQIGLIGIVPVSTGMITKQLQDQADSERTRAEQVARLAELDRRAAVNAERTRMARELHDMITNHFSAIAIQSAAVLSRKDLNAQAVQGVVESIRENSLQGMAEMRTMIELLRQDGEEVEATRRRVAEVGELVERAREAGMEVRLRVDGEARELPASVDLAGYRVLQESLTNALKHGDDAADLVISYDPGLITLTLDNSTDGAGARRSLPGAGAGIIGMRERVALVGGVFEAGPHDDGWRVRAQLPTGETI